VIQSGGSENVSAGGTDLGAHISGGEQDVRGYASGATVFGGSQVIEAGGTASSTTVANGGTLDVKSGGTADPSHDFGRLGNRPFRRHGHGHAGRRQRILVRLVGRTG
jgi:autotransporter passenger strand-loop-strand repeat protein